MTPKMTEITTTDGLRYWVDPADGRAQVLIETAGEFNARSVRIFQSLLARRPWDLALDIGSNYGEMIAALGGARVGRTLAFEPNPSLHPYLRRTAGTNGVDLELVPRAVGRSAGTARFFLDQEWSGSSSLMSGQTDHATTETEVEVVTLDEYFVDDPARSALIKIDVEGAECDVLRGGLGFLKGLDDYAIQLEILHMPPEDIAWLAATWRMYVFSADSLRPVRLPGNHPELARVYVSSTRFYQNDAMLLPR